MSPKKQPLNEEDRDLWARVKQSAKPLKKSRVTADFEAIADVLPPPKRSKAPVKIENAIPVEKPRANVPPPLASFDKRMLSRVARGQIDIGARLDLHGMTLERARRRLEKFLYDAQDDGVSLALVITGKGRGKNASTREIGALRREVPMWLSHPELRQLVIGFDEASPAHGGSGALYVRIRRLR